MKRFVLFLAASLLVTFGGCTEPAGPTTKCLEKLNTETGKWESTDFRVTFNPVTKTFSISDGTNSYTGGYVVNNQTTFQSTNATSSNGGTIGGAATANADGTFGVEETAGQDGHIEGWPVGGTYRPKDC